jgi:[ribosomal protein S5]-alanine N-acetyltransferase
VIVAETTRLRLRYIADGDAAFIVELLNDPDFLRNVGDRGVRDQSDARRYIISGPVASYQRFGFGLYLIELRGSAEAIGLCGLLHRDTHPDVEIGFALLPRFRGRGYALEAARATLHLATVTFALQRLVALTAPDNDSSMRVLEALGFRFERLVRFAEDQGESRLFVLEPRAH